MVLSDLRHIRLRHVLWIAGVTLLAGLLAYRPLLSPRTSLLWGYERKRIKTLAWLNSDQPELRKRGAWRILDYPDPVAIQQMTPRLYAEEPNPDVREAYVYTLGKLADPAGGPALEYVLSYDDSGYVRSAAWLAAARVDSARLAAFAAQNPPAEPWDRLGWANARLSLGDTGAARELLGVAVNGEPEMRRVASQALSKTLATALDALGLWPIDRVLPDGQTWDPGLVAAVEARLGSAADAPGGVDPAIRDALARELRRVAAAQVQPDRFRSVLGRILGARQRLARWIGAEST